MTRLVIKVALVVHRHDPTALTPSKVEAPLVHTQVITTAAPGFTGSSLPVKPRPLRLEWLHRLQSNKDSWVSL